MAKKRRQSKNDPNWKGIAFVILAIAFLWIVYNYFLVVLIASSLTLIIVIIAVIVGAYFILPRLGITALSALVGMLGFGRKN